MGIKTFLSRINTLIDGKESETAYVDLGARYTKVIVKEHDKIKHFLLGESTADRAKDILKTLKDNNLSAADVRLAVKGPETIIRYIPFPKMDKANIKQSLGFELNKHIPFPAESVYFDSCVLDEEYSKTDFLVLLAAVKMDAVNPIIEACAAEKINLSQITLAPLSLINLFMASTPCENNCALLDIGYSSTTLSIFRKSIPCLSRDIKTSGKAIIKKIAGVKNCEVARAEAIFIKNEEPDLLEISEDIFLGVCEEIRSSFDYFEMNTGEQVHNISLTGGFSYLQGADKAMAASLGLEITPWKPLEKLNFRPPNKITVSEDMFASALGLIV